LKIALVACSTPNDDGNVVGRGAAPMEPNSHAEETLNSLRTLPERVTLLEVRVGGVESQILQLRTEMRDEFSAMHRDLAT
jgi:hypothetical protein